ncbi:archease, partial [Chloroflexota bacterium]
MGKMICRGEALQETSPRVTPGYTTIKTGVRYFRNILSTEMSKEKKFQFIEHTADIGLIANGSTLAEAFANAACGLFSIIAELNPVGETETRNLEISEENADALLFEWLNQLIYLFDVEGLIFKRFDFIEFSGNDLTAIC